MKQKCTKRLADDIRHEHRNVIKTPIWRGNNINSSSPLNKQSITARVARALRRISSLHFIPRDNGEIMPSAGRSSTPSGEIMMRGKYKCPRNNQAVNASLFAI